MKIPTLAEQFQQRGFRMGKSEGRIEGKSEGLIEGERRGKIKGVVETLRDFNKLSPAEISNIIQNKFNLSSEEAEDYIKKYL